MQIFFKYKQLCSLIQHTHNFRPKQPIFKLFPIFRNHLHVTTQFCILFPQFKHCPHQFSIFRRCLQLIFFYDKKERIINFIINPQTKEESMRKTYQPSPQIPSLFDASKQLSHSLSTEESPRERPQHLHPHKEKSQLCKKFIQNGYCPYEKRCKFAHGLHELKKNDQMNCKYKTKICVGFLQQGFCPYGNRCNFIHPPCQAKGIRSIEPQTLQVKSQIVSQSRLLRMLNL